MGKHLTNTEGIKIKRVVIPLIHINFSILRYSVAMSFMAEVGGTGSIFGGSTRVIWKMRWSVPILIGIGKW